MIVNPVFYDWFSFGIKKQSCFMFVVPTDTKQHFILLYNFKLLFQCDLIAFCKRIEHFVIKTIIKVIIIMQFPALNGFQFWFIFKSWNQTMIHSKSTYCWRLFIIHVPTSAMLQILSAISYTICQRIMPVWLPKYGQLHSKQKWTCFITQKYFESHTVLRSVGLKNSRKGNTTCFIKVAPSYNIAAYEDILGKL